MDPGGPGMDRISLQPGRLLEIQNQVPPRPLELNLHFSLSDSCVNQSWRGSVLEQGVPVPPYQGCWAQGEEALLKTQESAGRRW